MTSTRSMVAAPSDEYWATMLPLLRPRMLLGRGEANKKWFPFSDPGVQYVHFARNAIYFLVRHFALAGAEVLVPAYFHGVELEALLAGGAIPRFFPVRSGMRVDPEDVRTCLRPQTRAVYLIHYLGFPGPVEALQQICRERGVLLIEDCALSLLSKIDGKPLGSFGDAAVFCLYKTLPTPDGGAIVLRQGQLRLGDTAPNRLGTARETIVSVLRRFQIDGSRFERGFAHMARRIGKAIAPPRDSAWVDVGTQRFNIADTRLLMSGVSRTIIEAQDLEAIVEARRRNYLHLQSLLEDLSEPLFPTLPDGVCPLFYPFMTSKKHELCIRLQASGVQAVLFWLHGEFSPPRGAFPDADVLRDTVLELPCHQDMTASHIERVANTVRTILRDLGSR
ncbi:MAG: DegT/DnrJ/EryC1/StrS family aminotransferase [Burkholderiales bacterium]